jgi:hypothetical protein
MKTEKDVGGGLAVTEEKEPETLKSRIYGSIFMTVLAVLVVVAVVGGSLCVSAAAVYGTGLLGAYSPWAEDYLNWIIGTGGVVGIIGAILTRKEGGPLFLFPAFAVSEFLAIVLWIVDFAKNT